MNRRRNLAIVWAAAVVLVISAIAVLTWQNYRYARSYRGGNDFLVQWMGIRTFLTEGTSPYSDETAARIQNTALGRTPEKGEPQLRYVYPLYSLLVFFPFALIPDFTLARAIFMTVLEVSIVLTMIFSMRLTRWRPHWYEMMLFIGFTLFGFHSVRPLLEGNSSILVALFVTSALLALKNGGDGVAGLLLAFATIKPNVVILLILFVTVWSLANGRWQLLGWLYGTLFLLSAATALLLPDWIMQNLREIIRFPALNPPGTLGAVLATAFPAMATRIARLIYGVLAGMILVEWWWARHAEFRGFLWAALFTLTLGQLVGIPSAPQNLIVLLPALVLVMAVWEERWRRAGQVLSIFSMLLLFFGIWAIYLAGVGSEVSATPPPLLLLPLPMFLMLGLYWIRWWAIRPPSVWFDALYLDHR